MTAPKLTSDQWQKVADQVIDGLSVRKAVDWIKEQWDIEVSKTLVARNKYVQEAIGRRKQLRALDAAEAIGNSLLPTVKGLTATIQDLQEERLQLREAQKAQTIGSKEYGEIGKQIRTIDMSLKDYTKQYLSILEFGSNVAEAQIGENIERGETIEALIKKMSDANKAEEKTDKPELIEFNGVRETKQAYEN